MLQSASGQRGQAAVESAIVLPVSTFILLGLLQMGMMQQARLFADYAAFRGARAASLQMGSCDAVLRAELAALTPSLGRSDNLATWTSTFEKAKAQQGSDVPVVINFWDIDPVPAGRTLDQPVTRERDVSHIHLRVYYYYEMNIPFVNWLLAHLYWAQFSLDHEYSDSDPYSGVDPLHPTTRARRPDGRALSGTESAAVVRYWTQAYARRNRYVVPLYASWSMRMFSRPAPAVEVVDGSNPCR